MGRRRADTFRWVGGDWGCDRREGGCGGRRHPAPPVPQAVPWRLLLGLGILLCTVDAITLDTDDASMTVSPPPLHTSPTRYQFCHNPPPPTTHTEPDPAPSSVPWSTPPPPPTPNSPMTNHLVITVKRKLRRLWEFGESRKQSMALRRDLGNGVHDPTRTFDKWHTSGNTSVPVINFRNSRNLSMNGSIIAVFLNRNDAHRMWKSPLLLCFCFPSFINQYRSKAYWLAAAWNV